MRTVEFDRIAGSDCREKAATKSIVMWGDALPGCRQFTAMAVGRLGQRHSLRDTEAALAGDPNLLWPSGTAVALTSNQ
jgi:hypothetical protein